MKNDVYNLLPHIHCSTIRLQNGCELSVAKNETHFHSVVRGLHLRIYFMNYWKCIQNSIKKLIFGKIFLYGVSTEINIIYYLEIQF